MPLLVSVLIALCALPQSATAQQADEITVYSSLAGTGVNRTLLLQSPLSAALDLRSATLARLPASSPVRYVALRDSTASRFLSPNRIAANAFRAVQDPSAVAVIGNLNPDATVLSAPILNRGGLLQVSPTNTAIGLTRGGLGSGPGEPERYQPSGRRHDAPRTPQQPRAGRCPSHPHERARVSARGLAQRRGLALRRGRGWASRTTPSAKPSQGCLNVSTRPRQRRYRAVLDLLEKRRPECVAYAGITRHGATRLYEDLAVAVPAARLFGSDGLAELDFTDPTDGGISGRVGRRIVLTLPFLGPSAYPAVGQRVLRRLFPSGRSPVVQALYGYEAMRLVLDAIAVGGPDREQVRNSVLATRRRHGVIGKYGFDRYGDTTSRRFGLSRIRNGQLSIRGTVTAR